MQASSRAIYAEPGYLSYVSDGTSWLDHSMFVR